MSIEITPEIEARIREIVRDEISKAETTQRPPWSFDRMDARMLRVEDQRKPTAAPKKEIEATTEEQQPEL